MTTTASRKHRCPWWTWFIVALAVNEIAMPFDEVPAAATPNDAPAIYPTKQPAARIRGLQGSPNSTMIVPANDPCGPCNLVSVDCLHLVPCVLAAVNQDKKIVEGVALRAALKESATTVNNSFKDDKFWTPLGKTFQSLTKSLFRLWLGKNQLPHSIMNRSEAFVNGSLYPYCRDRGLEGRCCIVKPFGQVEEYGTLELDAIKHVDGDSAASNAQSLETVAQLRQYPFDASPSDYLIMFSHMSRIAFNLRPHMLGLYKERRITIDHSDGTSRPYLSVAIHVRRADSCSNRAEGFHEYASPIDSEAQTSNNRLCYATGVYLDALEKIVQEASGKDVMVYLATDDSKSILQEISTNFTSLYQSVSWQYLDHSRHLFDYFSGDEQVRFIESPDNTARPLLGEAALLDIWHLSHAQVFVGHLGSRFGKVSYWQAVARHNAIVPFFSVDGHSLCCQIDESCALVKPYIVSMGNCLTFEAVESQYDMNADYWERGVTLRSMAARRELKLRAKRSGEAFNESAYIIL